MSFLNFLEKANRKIDNGNNSDTFLSGKILKNETVNTDTKRADTYSRPDTMSALMLRSNELISRLESSQDSLDTCKQLIQKGNEIWNKLELMSKEALTLKKPIDLEILKALQIYWNQEDGIFKI